MTDQPDDVFEGDRIPEEEAEPTEQPEITFDPDALASVVGPLGSPTSTDLIERFRDMVAISLERGLVTEPVDYGVGLTAVPGPQGSPMAALVLFLAIPSPVIGQKIQLPMLLQDLWLDQAGVDQLVNGALQQMFGARTQMLAQANGQGPG